MKIIREALKNDIRYVLINIRDFNKGLKSLEETSENILNDLNYETTTQNLETVESHLFASMDEDDKIPLDKDIVLELYQMLK